ncbi:MAG: ComEC/Rec2 family competence protein, partial [Candidatus Scatosoma sp.]
LILNDLSFDYSAAEGRLCLYAYKTDALQGITEGCNVAFNAEITANTLWKNDSESGGNGETRAYYWRRDIKYEAQSYKNLRVTGEERNLFESIRFRLKQTLDLSMDKDASALCLAILTGETATVDGELLDSFRYGGVAHIFAVSGLHLGALFAFVTAIFKKGRLAALPPAVKWAVSAAVIVFYGGICGFSAGVIRATVMCLVFYADKLLGVKGDSAESMGKAALIVLIFSPVSLFDAGFLLSFAAVAGILMLLPSLGRFFISLLPQKRRAAQYAVQTADMQAADMQSENADGAAQGKSLPRAVAEKCLTYLAVTLSATLATAPVLSTCFSYVSGVSLFLNMLIVPPVSAAFPLCLFVAFFSLIFAPLAQAALYVPSALFSALTALFYAFDFSRFALEIPFSALGTAACYAALFSLSDKLNLKYGFRVAVFAAGFAALILSFFL